MDGLTELRPNEDGAEVVWEWRVSDHLMGYSKSDPGVLALGLGDS